MWVFIRDWQKYLLSSGICCARDHNIDITNTGFSAFRYSYYQTINYAATDQATYQQDVVIHRTTGTAYQETVDGLKVWHIYVGDHCQADYGDIRFTKSDGTTELNYYRHSGYTSSQARFTVILENANQAGVLQIFYGHSGATTTSLTTHPKMVYTTATVDVHNEHDWSPTHGDNLSVAWNPNKATYISMWWNNDDVNLNPEAFLESLTTAIQEHTHGLGIMIILFTVFFFLAVAWRLRGCIGHVGVGTPIDHAKPDPIRFPDPSGHSRWYPGSGRHLPDDQGGASNVTNFFECGAKYKYGYSLLLY